MFVNDIEFNNVKIIFHKKYTVVFFKNNIICKENIMHFDNIETAIANINRREKMNFKHILFKNRKVVNIDKEVEAYVNEQLSGLSKNSPVDYMNKLSQKLSKLKNIGNKLSNKLQPEEVVDFTETELPATSG